MTGSGLSSLTTSPSKLFTPELEVWSKRASEDAQLTKQRKQAYEELKQAKLGAVASQTKAQTERRHAEKGEFARRQAERVAKEKAEKDRAAALRKQALEQNRREFAMEGVPGYGPTRWCWPTAHHHPRHCNGTGSAGTGESDVAVSLLLTPGGMVLAPETDYANDSVLVHSTRKFSPQQGESELLRFVEGEPSKLREMKEREKQLRLAAEAEARTLKDQLRQEREAEAIALRKAEAAAKEAQKKAQIAKAKQIKKEMAVEAKKAARVEAEKAKVRYERAQAERAEMVKRLTVDRKLRDEDEIANERRDGLTGHKD